MTADTLYPAAIAHISRQVFCNSCLVTLRFIHRHARNQPQLLACLRSVAHGGPLHFVPERLARLLWMERQTGQKPERAAHCRMSLTHEEIGEFIGASRETVTRTLSIFKNRHLVAQHGCTITIPSRMALESYTRG